MKGPLEQRRSHPARCPGSRHAAHTSALRRCRRIPPRLFQPRIPVPAHHRGLCHHGHGSACGDGAQSRPGRDVLAQVPENRIIELNHRTESFQLGETLQP